MGQIEVQEHLVLQNTGTQLGGQRRVPAVQSGRRYLLFRAPSDHPPCLSQAFRARSAVSRASTGLHLPLLNGSQSSSRRNRVSSQIVCCRHPSTARRLKLCQAEHLSISTSDPDAPFVGREDGAGPPAGGLPGLSTAKHLHHTSTQQVGAGGRPGDQPRIWSWISRAGRVQSMGELPGKHGRIGGPFPVLGGTLRRSGLQPGHCLDQQPGAQPASRS